MSFGSQPPEQAERHAQLNEAGIWLSQDGTWEWDGANWIPRGTDAAWLGGFLSFSKRDLDANRAGRLGTAALVSGAVPGSLLQSPPSTVDVRAASVGIVDRAGRIKTQRAYFDQAEILAQLGLMPHPAVS